MNSCSRTSPPTGSSLAERLRDLGIREDLIPKVATIATAEAIKLVIESGAKPVDLLEGDSESPLPGWWTRKFAQGAARCSMRTLERATAAGTIRTSRANCRSVLLLAEDVVRWRAGVSQHVARGRIADADTGTAARSG